MDLLTSESLTDTSKLIDLVAMQGRRRFRVPPQVAIDRERDEIVVRDEGADEARLDALLRDMVDVAAPEVTLAVALHAAVPGAAPSVLGAGELDRALPPPLHRATMARAAAGVATFALGKASTRSRVRVQAHRVVGGELVLLCEFAIATPTAGGARRWIGGTASARIATGGAMVVAFPGGALSVEAQSASRPPRELVAIPCELLTGGGLRSLPPQLVTAAPELTLAPPPARAQHSIDWLRQRCREVSTGVHFDIISPGRLAGLANGQAKRARATAARDAVEALVGPLEALTLECTVPAATNAAVPEVVVLPTLPGRVAVVVHAIREPPIERGWRGGLVALRWQRKPESVVNGGAVRLRGPALGERDGAAVKVEDAPVPPGPSTPILGAGELVVRGRWQ